MDANDATTREQARARVLELVQTIRDDHLPRNPDPWETGCYQACDSEWPCEAVQLCDAVVALLAAPGEGA